MRAPRYYAAQISASGSILAQPSYPVETYDTAIGIHAQHSRMGYPPPAGQIAVLLDLGSVHLDDPRELARILHEDPVLSAIFKLGRQYERGGPLGENERKLIHE